MMSCFGAFTSDVNSVSFLPSVFILFAVYSLLYVYIYICIIIRDNVMYEGFRILDIL